MSRNATSYPYSFPTTWSLSSSWYCSPCPAVIVSACQCLTHHSEYIIARWSSITFQAVTYTLNHPCCFLLWSFVKLIFMSRSLSQIGGATRRRDNRSSDDVLPGSGAFSGSCSVFLAAINHLVETTRKAWGDQARFMPSRVGPSPIPCVGADLLAGSTQDITGSSLYYAVKYILAKRLKEAEIGLLVIFTDIILCSA